MSSEPMPLPAPNRGNTLDLNKMKLHEIKSPKKHLDAQHLMLYLDGVMTMWNEYAEEEEFPYRLGIADEDRVKLLNHGLNGNAAAIRLALSRFQRVEGSHHDGKLYETQIRTTIDLIEKGLGTEKYLSCGGIMQSGKTMVLLLMFLIEPVIRYLDREQRIKPLCCITNHKSLENQIRNDMIDLISLHQSLGVYDVRTGECLTIEHCFNEIIETPFHALDSSICCASDSVVRSVRCRSKKIKAGKKVQGTAAIYSHINDAKSKGMTPGFYIDESHFGSGVDGVFGEWAKVFLRNPKTNPALIRCFSATPYEQMSPERFEMIHLWLGPNFTGYPWFNGERCPTLDGYVEKKPEIREITAFANLSDPLHMGSYSRISSYLKYVCGLKGTQLSRAINRSHTFETEHRRYQRYFVDSIVKIIKKCMISPSGPRCHGIMIRVGKGNDIAKEIMREVEKKLDPNICFIPYTSENAHSHERVSTLVDDNAGHNPYVIWATATARMGCRFPISTGCFIDLTWNSQTAMAELQGCLGRSYGYFKDTMVILTQNGFDSVQSFYRRHGRITKRAGVRVDSSTQNGRPAWNIRIFPEDIRRQIRQNPDSKILKEATKIIDQIEVICNDTNVLPEKLTNGNEGNSRLIIPLIERLSLLIEQKTSMICDEEGRAPYDEIPLLHFANKKEQISLKQKQKKRIASPYLTILPIKGQDTLRRWPYGNMVARRTSPHTKLGLANMFHGKQRSLERQKVTGQRGRVQQRTTAMDGSEKFEPQLWLYSGGFKQCTKNDKYGPKSKKLRVVAITLVSRVPIHKTWPDLVDDHRANDKSVWDNELVTE